VVSGNFLEGKNEIHNVHAKYFKNYMGTSKLYYPIGKETLAPYSVI
jgi:hypothetical protein